MKAASTAVLEGTVVSANSYVGGRSCSIIFTTLSVRVDTAIKGVAANTIIKVVQTGGTVNGSKQEVEDDSLMAVGQQAFLFLRLDQSSGRYVILGGPQGQLPVIDRHVYTLDQIQSGGNIVLPWSVAGQPEQSFAASLEG
jgi:hypothetical protein